MAATSTTHETPKSQPNEAPPSSARKHKRRLTIGRAVSDLALIAGRARDLDAIWRHRRVRPLLREQVMVAVANANACVYCAFAHHEMALAAGIEQAELALIESGEITESQGDLAVVIAWARSRAQADLGPADEALEAALEERYSVSERRDLDTVVRVMTLMNLAGNSFEALLVRLKFDPVPQSHLIDELLVGGTFAVGTIPAGLAISLQRGRSPIRLIGQLRAFARGFDADTERS